MPTLGEPIHTVDLNTSHTEEYMINSGMIDKLPESERRDIKEMKQMVRVSLLGEEKKKGLIIREGENESPPGISFTREYIIYVMQPKGNEVTPKQAAMLDIIGQQLSQCVSSLNLGADIEKFKTRSMDPVKFSGFIADSLAALKKLIPLYKVINDHQVSTTIVRLDEKVKNQEIKDNYDFTFYANRFSSLIEMAAEKFLTIGNTLDSVLLLVNEDNRYSDFHLAEEVAQVRNLLSVA